MSLSAVPAAVPARSRPQGCGRGGLRRRRAFTLVEMLVVVITIMILVGLTGAALSAARARQQRLSTETLIGKLDAIVMQAFTSHGSRRMPTPLPAGITLPPGTAAQQWAWYVRRHFINGELPDRWSDVEFIAANPALFTTPVQRACAAYWNSMNPKPNATSPSRFEGAECLFMIVMRGGVANCLDCSDLKTASVGDQDGDGAPEFLDGWGNPIGFILWPAALELPAGSGRRFFSGTRVLDAPFATTPTPPPPPAPGLRMLPLIYSAGPDGLPGLERNNEQSNLALGANCGNWQIAPTATSAATLEGADDNVTNLDAEAAQP